MQTNNVCAAVLAIAIALSLFSLVEIKASRPYKRLKIRSDTLTQDEKILLERYETILKSISLGVLFLGAGTLLWRISQ
jgi:hypothetical protein